MGRLNVGVSTCGSIHLKSSLVLTTAGMENCICSQEHCHIHQNDFHIQIVHNHHSLLENDHQQDNELGLRGPRHRRIQFVDFGNQH